MDAHNPDLSLDDFVAQWKSFVPGLEIRDEQFEYNLSAPEMPSLFKQLVKRIWVEVFSYCNRKCFFCPNATGSRTTQRYLPPAIYTKILEDLRSIDYDGLFAFHEYNEPLSDRVILERIAECRDALPHAERMITTNGDYLDPEYLEALYDAGLRRMNISIYGPNQGQFVDGYIITRMKNICEKLGMDAFFSVATPGYSYVIHTNYKDMPVSVKGNNLGSHGFDRAGSYEGAASHAKRRVAPCYAPFYEFHVEASGKVKPCCNIYGDNPDHQQYLTGDIADGRSIFEHYFDHAMVNWRKSLHTLNPESPACVTCSWPWI